LKSGANQQVSSSTLGEPPGRRPETPRNLENTQEAKEAEEAEEAKEISRPC